MRRTITIHHLAALRAEIMARKLAGPNGKPMTTDQMAGLALLSLEYVMGLEGLSANEAFMDYLRASMVVVTDKHGATSESVRRLIDGAKTELQMMDALKDAPNIPMLPDEPATTDETDDLKAGVTAEELIPKAVEPATEASI